MPGLPAQITGVRMSPFISLSGAGLALLFAIAAEAQTTTTGSIRGQVVTGDDAKPLAARVWLVGAVRPRNPGGRATFRFDSLQPGRYHLRATFIGYAPADSVVSLLPGAHLRVVLRLSPTPVQLTEMTIRETAKPPAPVPPTPRPYIRPVECGLLLVVSAKTMVCTSTQSLPRSTVVRGMEFLGPNSLIRQAAQNAVTQAGFIPERELQLNERTWLITAHDPSRPVGTGNCSHRDGGNRRA